MSHFKKGAIGAGVAAVVAGVTLASTSGASAHDSYEPVGNVGDAVNYATDHLQGEHLNAPLFGFGPAVENPVGWGTGHLLDFHLDVIKLAASGHTTDGSRYPATTTAPAPTPTHDHSGTTETAPHEHTSTYSAPAPAPAPSTYSAPAPTTAPAPATAPTGGLLDGLLAPVTGLLGL